MRELERAVMEAGVGEGELMGRAGRALGRAIGMQYQEVGMAVAYVGKGHNGGDALIALGVLREEFGWRIGVRAGYGVEEWAELPRERWAELGLDGFLAEGFEREVCGPLLLLDGLLGIGASGGAPREPLAGLAGEMNRLSGEAGARVVAVDVPTGVDADGGELFPGVVRAERTFTIGAVKRGLLSGGAVDAVGQLALVRVEGLEERGGGGMEMICPQEMTMGKERRAFDFHKGKAGRVGVYAGSRAFAGAALLTALGAQRAGAGLVTLYVRPDACEAVGARLAPEVMLRPCADAAELLGEKLDAVVAGPGLGMLEEEAAAGLLKLVERTEVPMVIDADGLNLLAGREGVKLDGRHVLTPHPGEFARLAPESEGMDREEAARAFAEGSGGAVLLLKGARTLVGRRGAGLWANSTGTPAMSNGGQGDLLAGVIGGLLAGGMDGMEAAGLGAWLCGHAAELGAEECGEVCAATDTAARIGRAWRNWRRGAR